ncbi:phytanoyl-CoA dioxygenase family protein [Nocardioides sp. GY 10127]|uniref:phytanoyl-CoA dioxygenase family protein n=1 Tax=Nocardioides sp. GY 10127 TaxID=2569762 RepID=UPI0010A919AB|nr:phytanoyl-CoA dioxygenase family protein [Nocardioides sp. GY 10127]TIC80031.1 phytanoyl-CoA dioxygenase family protein [Nocardioides sp. GY 10127]
MSGIKHLPGNSTVEDVVAVINADGGVIIDDFLDAEAMEVLLGEIKGALALAKNGIENELTGTSTRRASRLFGRCPKMVDVAMHPLYHDVARAILEKPIQMWYGEMRMTVAPGIQIGMTQAIEIQPGQKAQPLHRDDSAFMWRHPDYGREGRLQIMLAGTDFTEENGATMVIPGSQVWDDERGPKVEEAVPATMKKGSALIWTGSVYHGGGANVSEDDVRIGITMSYDLSNLRQEENMYLSLTDEQIRALPEPVQRLLGWDSGENYMGWVEVDGLMVNPHFLLEDEPEIVQPTYTSIS